MCTVLPKIVHQDESWTVRDGSVVFDMGTVGSDSELGGGTKTLDDSDKSESSGKRKFGRGRKFYKHHFKTVDADRAVASSRESARQDPS